MYILQSQIYDFARYIGSLFGNEIVLPQLGNIFAGRLPDATFKLILDSLLGVLTGTVRFKSSAACRDVQAFYFEGVN